MKMIGRLLAAGLLLKSGDFFFNVSLNNRILAVLAALFLAIRSFEFSI